MSNQASTVVQKVWNHCHTLRDDGVSYTDYVEQLTYLLFLKMAQEMESMPDFMKEQLGTSSTKIPENYSWKNLIKKDGDELEILYRHTLEGLAKEPGMLGQIFRKSQNKIQDPAKLKRLIGMIDTETWSGLDIDIKGEIYEGLLEKNAQDTKSGAGQYFTPRALIKAMVKCVNPKPGQTICDPACGTGGFILAAHEYLSQNNKMNKGQKDKLKSETFSGWELVDNTARLCVMNLFLHGIGGSESPIHVMDSLGKDPGERFNLILTNPPFGKKSSTTIVGEDGKLDKEKISYERDDFWATTSNKQLNFLQHIKTLLDINGTASVVLPDNVLFEGGAGEIVRKQLLKTCNVHTILRLPTGIFYAQGVKANVIFFEKREASANPWTKEIWIYDYRTNIHHTLKTNQLKVADLEDFVKCYNSENIHKRKESDRFKRFSYDELIKRDKVSLDIFWLKDESLEDTDNLPEPEIIAAEIVENLEAALEQFKAIEADLTSD